MPIGNDIVDLKLEKISEYNSRFPYRVLSKTELNMFLKNKSPLFLWKSWAAKEAAYKYIKQINPLTVFSPSMFILENNLVRFKNYRVPVNFKINNDYIYCWTPSSKSQNQIMKAPQKSDESQIARDMIKNIISKIIHCNIDKLQIQKNNYGVPEVFYNGQRLNFNISITHHGRFVGAAANI